MRQSLLSRMAKRAFKQGQVGQTIVIMAFGFIVLLAFVGIVTDVSLMFVRYSTLRRAVDAAAVAAAGQVRRTVYTADELAAAGNDKTKANGMAFARNIANINLAARQFIEFYGLSPSNVVVDSCDTIERDSASPNYNARLADLLECRADQAPRKLVQVTAQLPSPTIFLRLIGWGTVTLEASAISETAVLDVVLIFDAAESMLKQTTYNEWKKVPVTGAGGAVVYNLDGFTPSSYVDQSVRYLPVRVNFSPNWNYTNPLYLSWTAASGKFTTAWQTLLNMTQQQIYNDTANFPEIPFTWNGTTATYVANPATPPRKDCRVRFFPYAETVAERAMLWLPSDTVSIEDDLRKSYTSLLTNPSKPGGATLTGNYPAKFDGFLPAYDFYGCCNDPNGDFKFDDLICQPFQKVRNATERFLQRVDFVRGDRVALVTFDQTAHLIDPDGDTLTGTTSQTPMITSEAYALAALRRIVGVRAEPTYYADTGPIKDGVWDAFVKGGVPYDGTANGGIPVRYNESYSFVSQSWHTATNVPTDNSLNQSPLGTLNYYGVRYDCIFNNATLSYPFSLYSSQANQTDYNTYYPSQIQYFPYDSTLPYLASRWPTPLAAMTGSALMNPDLNLSAWDNSMSAGYDSRKYARQTNKGLFSYEFRAACGGNNVGAALRVGSNALLDPATVRIGNTGAVWVMVLLGDGAASASDPVQRNGVGIDVSDPYGDGPLTNPKKGYYGGLGLCPYGSPDDQMGLTAGWQTRPPRCSDDGSEASNGGVRGYKGPASRHTCTGAAVGANNNATIDIGNVGCEAKYDVDDYARDWADFIGLTELPAISPFKNLPGAQTGRSLLQLPTIFTIGFGLDFPETGGCGGEATKFTNINDCLGEELLRYIADVGDNNRVDTDYQQDYLPDGVINGVTTEGQYEYGDRGPCELPITNYSSAAAAAAASAYHELINNAYTMGDSCGNYYNAPNGAALTKVFEDIASRMFTRITR
ncbi:MAG: hypothetical protein IT321_29600 [Anaerolineae bacterium]|nr:hypothetical protein [Anaerolineae bacterium]